MAMKPNPFAKKPPLPGGKGKAPPFGGKKGKKVAPIDPETLNSMKASLKD